MQIQSEQKSTKDTLIDLETKANTDSSVTLEKVSCCICQKEIHGSPLFSINNPSLKIRQTFSVIRCDDCGLAYVNPRPTPESMSQFYHLEVISSQLEINTKIKKGNWRKILVSKISTNIVFERIKSLKKAIKLNSQSRVLDLGCGKGAFIHQLKKMFNLDVYGLDLDSEAVRFCNENLKISTFQGTLENGNQNLKNSSFDLVSMWHTLEHSHDPRKSLLKAKSYLNHNGILVVEVPNEKSLENFVFGKHSYLYEVPLHLYNFDLKTLSLLMESVGLQIVKVEFPIGAGGWFGSLQRFLLNDKAFKNFEKYVLSIMLIGAFIYPLEFLLSFTKWGSVLRVYTKKK